MFFRVGGFSAFWLLWLLRGFLWLSWLFISHHLHSQFLSFRILCIASSAAAGGFLAFWLFGFLAWLFRFWRLSGFGFSHPDAFPVGFLHPQHRKFLFSPPATPLSIKMHAYLNHHFFDHHATATF